MSQEQLCRPALLVVALLALGISAPVGAAGDADTREISAYKLTDAGLAKFGNATRRLDEAVQRSPDLCDDRASDDGDDAKTLDQLVAKLDADPRIRQAIQSAGMSTREYAVFSFAAMQAGMAAWALDQPGGKLAPGIAMDNVNFYRRNAATLTKIGEESNAADSCEDESESGGDEEDVEAEPAE